MLWLIICTTIFGTRLENFTCNPNCKGVSFSGKVPPGKVIYIYHRDTFNYTKKPLECLNHKIVNNGKFISYSMEPYDSYPKWAQEFSYRNKSVTYGKLVNGTSHLNWRRKYPVCWVVSNLAPKERLKLYSELKKFIHIETRGLINKRQISKKKYEKFMQNCVTYLSFEKRKMDGYITEKFWNPLFYGAIPIVFPNEKSAYTAHTPGMAFIHMNDYSIPNLARYIRRLSNQGNLWKRHHEWRNFFSVERHVLGKDHLCLLCYL